MRGRVDFGDQQRRKPLRDLGEFDRRERAAVGWAVDFGRLLRIHVRHQ